MPANLENSAVAIGLEKVSFHSNPIEKQCQRMSGLKLNIQKTKIMASSPIISWQIDGETVETVRDFIFVDSKITADGDCSHEIKKMLAPWKKSYDQPR